MRDLPGLLLATTPGVRRLRGKPDHEGWAATLTSAADNADLGSLGKAMRSTAATAFTDVDFDVLQNLGQQTDPAVLVRAAELSERMRERAPSAAFVLGWLTLTLWIHSPPEGRSLDDAWAIFHHTWQVVPYACAITTMQLGGIYGATRLTQLAYETLRVAVYRGLGRRDVSAVRAALARYGDLRWRLFARYENAVGGLADDLCSACVPGHGDLRAEVAALMWSLGRVPECRAVVRNGADSLPKSLARRVVRESLRSIPEDPLVQYVWLEMKDRPRLPLREHESLFAVINHRWDQWSLDQSTWDLFDQSPSVAYATALIKILAGELDKASGYQFLNVCEEIEGWGGAPWGVLCRYRALRMLVGEYLDLIPDSRRGEYLEHLESEVDQAGKMIVKSWQQPALPQLGARLSAPLFDLVDWRLGVEPSGDNARAALEALERARASGLAYWLRTAPAPVDGDVRVDAQSLLDTEMALIERLRGATFLTMDPVLPFQFNWVDLDIDIVLGFDEHPGARAAFYSSDRARRELLEIERELDSVAEALEHLMPGVGRFHLPAPVTVDELVETLTAHKSHAIVSAPRPTALDLDRDRTTHWGPRSRGVSSDSDDAGWLFSGRHRALGELVGWLAADWPPAVRVVAGPPGSGKSAVLARLVTSADSNYRSRIEGLQPDDPTIPPLGVFDVTFHAKERTVQEFIDHVAALAGMVGNSAATLFDALDRRNRRLVIAVDAVDEASEPTELCRLICDVAGRGNRVLVGCDPHVVGKLSDPEPMRLDDSSYFDGRDVELYVNRLLSQLAVVTDGRNGSRLAEEIAAAAEGNFLVAELATHAVAARGHVEPPFPRNVSEAFERLMATLPNERRTRDLLLPLALAFGSGLPVELWLSATEALLGRR